LACGLTSAGATRIDFGDAAASSSVPPLLLLDVLSQESDESSSSSSLSSGLELPSSSSSLLPELDDELSEADVESPPQLWSSSVVELSVPVLDAPRPLSGTTSASPVSS
jgi:hypothetical protein